MRCVILSSGPSLPAQLPRIDLDGAMVLGVNFASHHATVDWQVSGDSITWEALRQAPRIGVCAPETILQNVQRGDYDHAGVSFQHLRGLNWWRDLSLYETNYSMTAAIRVAMHLGAQGDLLIYGADMGGMVDLAAATLPPGAVLDASDCAGRTHADRGLERWAKEASELIHISERAAASGLHVIRVLPSGAYPVITDPMNRSRKPGRPPASEARPMPTDEPIVTAVKVVPSRLKCRRCATEYDAKMYDRRGGAEVPTCRCPRCGQVDRMPRLAV